MKNQFFYKRQVEKPVQIEGQEKQYNEFLDSFNINKVIRSIELEDGRRLLILDDFHERMEKVPQFNKDRTKVVGQTKERNTFQSEIFLSKEDNIKFVETFQ